MGYVEEMAGGRSAITAEVVAHPRLVQKELAPGVLSGAWVVFPIATQEPGHVPTYSEVAMRAGRVGDEPVTATRTAMQALRELEPGMTVRTEGSWEHVTTRVGERTVFVERQIADVAHLVYGDGELVSMGEEGRGFVLREQDFVGAGVFTQPDEPMCPVGVFDVEWQDPEGPEGAMAVSRVERPVTSLKDAREAVATSPMPVPVRQWEAAAPKASGSEAFDPWAERSAAQRAAAGPGPWAASTSPGAAGQVAGVDLHGQLVADLAQGAGRVDMSGPELFGPGR